MTPSLLAPVLGLSLALFAGAAAAHLSPPVTFLSDADAIRQLTPATAKHHAREVNLSAEQRKQVRQRCGWRPDEASYRVYVARDAGGSLLGAVVFLSESTLHGPMRVAVGIDPAGAVRDARIVQSTEEAAIWTAPLNDERFGRRYAGRRLDGDFKVTATGPGEDMRTHYEQVVARLIQRALALFEVSGLAAAPSPAGARKRDTTKVE